MASETGAPPPVAKPTRNFRHYAQKIRVPAGFVVAILFLITAKPNPVLYIYGFAVGLIGAALRGWASGHLRKDQQLTVRGPYRMTRNPLYLGSFLMVCGCVVAGGNLFLSIGVPILFLLIYLPVMRAEESHLYRIFAEDYPAYAKSVPLILPKLTAFPAACRDGFETALYRRHREYRALIGLFAVFALLFLRMWWKP
jgi:protein-S-isoprenylcysteine O-methyltransferase Ste14